MSSRRPPSRRPWVALGILALSACQASGPPVAPRPEAPLSARAFFRDPQIEHLALSPDGDHLAGVVRPSGYPVLFAKRVRGEQKRALGKLRERGAVVRAVGWSGDSTIVVAYESPSDEARRGLRTLRMKTVRLERWRTRESDEGWKLSAHPDERRWVLSWLPHEADRILVTRWESDEEGASVRRARTRDGIGPDVVDARPWVRRWFADATGAVRAARGYDPDTAGEVAYARASTDAPFERLVGRDLIEESHLDFAGFSLDPNELYVYATTEHGRRGVYAYDLAERRTTRLVHADPDYDVGPLVHSPVDGQLWAVEVNGEKPSLHFVDAAARKEHASIDATFRGTTNRIVDASQDGRTAIVRVSGDTTPTEYYAYDRQRREMALQSTAHPELERVDLAPMRPVSYTARDGVVVPGYLSVPPGSEGAPLPTIVVVHDGPTERVRWGFDASVQFLVSRGYAVFQPNFRGSSGYGREFERLGRFEWGGAMQDDVSDGVRWLVDEGIADPDRIAIYGRGYGGYAALLGLATTPELYRAGAAWGAVTDRVALARDPDDYESTDPNPPVSGAEARDLERLAASSPARLADRIRAPVLLGHGTADRSVDVAQTHAMREALEAAGGEVEAHVYRDETHALAGEEARTDFHEQLADFLERALRARVPL